MGVILKLVSLFSSTSAITLAAVEVGFSGEFLALAGLIVTAVVTLYGTNRSNASSNRGTAVTEVKNLWERNDQLEKENRLYEATLLLHEADRASRQLPPIPRPEVIA